ncbi:MAG TPA: transposase, partial [Nevskiaceae bacterium]|nr:transposase [Nevskiaceae bacterium]
MTRDPLKGHNALRKGRVSLPWQIYNVTTATVDRRPVFSDFDCACAASRCFARTQLLGDAAMLAWVLMPDHVHWLIQLGERDSLDLVISRLKSASAREVNRLRASSGNLWQRSFHDHALRREEDLKTAARYIVGNPVRAGLAEHVGGYPYWNAIWLQERALRA